MSEQRDPVEFLMSVHYKFFMSNPRFWYDKLIQESDKIIVVLASNIRLERKQA